MRQPPYSCFPSQHVAPPFTLNLKNRELFLTHLSCLYTHLLANCFLSPLHGTHISNQPSISLPLLLIVLVITYLYNCSNPKHCSVSFSPFCNAFSTEQLECCVFHRVSNHVTLFSKNLQCSSAVMVIYRCLRQDSQELTQSFYYPS